MAFRTAEMRVEKYLHQLPRHRMADHKAAETDEVEIIILDALMRGKALMDQARSDANYFVSGDGGAHPTSANGYAALHFSAGHGASQSDNKVGIVVVRFRLAVTEVYHLIASRA